MRGLGRYSWPLLRKRQANMSKPDLPAVLEAASEISELSDIPDTYLPDLINLSDAKKRTLIAVVGNVLSESSMTETELAAELGITRKTLWSHRQNREFGHALTTILGDIVRGTSDRAIRCLFKRAEHDTAAVKVWLNMAELWMDKRQQLNINAKLDGGRSQGSFQDMVDDTLTLIGSTGWNWERLKTRWDLLKAEGAF